MHYGIQLIYLLFLKCVLFGKNLRKPAKQWGSAGFLISYSLLQKVKRDILPLFCKKYRLPLHVLRRLKVEGGASGV